MKVGSIFLRSLGSVFCVSEESQLHVPLDPINNLRIVMLQSELAALNALNLENFHSESVQNLTAAQRLLLQWFWKILVLPDSVLDAKSRGGTHNNTNKA